LPPTILMRSMFFFAFLRMETRSGHEIRSAPV
jgi:hypothetical protein